MEIEAQSSKTGCAAHPASHSMSTDGYFQDNKAGSLRLTARPGLVTYNQHDNERKSRTSSRPPNFLSRHQGQVYTKADRFRT